MKALVISTMFPNRVQPVHAVFVRNRIQRVGQRCEVRVLSPIPYFPFASCLKKYKHRPSIPREDVIAGLRVSYPRFLSIPAFCKPLDGVFLFLSLWWTVRRMRKEFPFDLIDAHLAYPDGFAAVLLGRLLGKPVVVTLRGHDVNDVPRYPVRRRQVRLALTGASRVIAVADALRRAGIELGADPSRSETVSNGVDTTVFYPTDPGEARRKLGLPLDRKVLVAVGHLVERKGFHLLVDALKVLKDRGREVPFLAIVGGPGEEGDYSQVIRDRIRAHALESLACGTPVVATNVWGTPEVISSEAYGVLVDRTPESIASGLECAMSRAWDRRDIAAHARTQTWDGVADRVIATFEKALGARPEREEAVPSPLEKAEEPTAP
jgi:teichuronic acid biosynthesis glycosyltransferase TuaC